MKGSTLTFIDFRKEAGKRGLPTSFKAWTHYEGQGLITFRRGAKGDNVGGQRLFANYEEINKLLNEFEEKLK